MHCLQHMERMWVPTLILRTLIEPLLCILASGVHADQAKGPKSCPQDTPETQGGLGGVLALIPSGVESTGRCPAV